MATMISGLGGASGYGENSWKTNIAPAGTYDSNTTVNLTGFSRAASQTSGLFAALSY